MRLFWAAFRFPQTLVNPRQAYMKSIHYSCRLFVTGVSLFFLSSFPAVAQHGPVQDSVVLAPDVAVPPVIDGVGNDLCWQNVPWQSIAQVWIPYGSSVDSEDYSGRYKVVWSSTTNLLYFLIEIRDDVFVDGYDPSSSGGAIYDFDITEVFIDEDASGGEHRYDGNGTNAENAFAYHMYANFPVPGEVDTVCQVDDMAGTQVNSRRADYTSHFPQFALRTTGTTAVREFSLIVYNDTYTDSNKEAARAQLAVGKVMGLSVAYCDNDNPNEYPKVRDNMFGSVWEPSPGNLHWINADYFGRVKLVSNIPTGVSDKRAVEVNSVKLFPNPASSSLQLQLDNSYRGEVSIRLFNILGQEVFRTSASKMDRLLTQPLVLNHLPPGPYFIQAQMGQSVFRGKLVLVDKR
jgi:hypothetical protein